MGLVCQQEYLGNKLDDLKVSTCREDRPVVAEQPEPNIAGIWSMQPSPIARFKTAGVSMREVYTNRIWSWGSIVPP
jgi:hypothetical protein